MSDKMGKLPAIHSAREALTEVLSIARDKRGHLMLREHCDWLELKLKAIRLLSQRGLKAGD